MFNRNGNNGAHDGAAVASRNGNGHKPDAAIPAEHDLLWDGLPPAVTQALGQALDPSLVSQRKGRAGRVFDYLEGHAVIDQANRIFGYGGWGYELVGDVTLRQIETVDSETGEMVTSSVYSAPVRVTVAGALPRTDTGFHAVTEKTVDGHDTALKGAVTDGMKRAFRSFGVQFGNGFYGDQPSATVPQPERVPVPGQPQRQVRPGPVQRQARSAAAGGQGRQRRPGGQAAQEAHGAVLQAGLRRGADTGRCPEGDGQKHRRPDGRRARVAHRGGGQQAQPDAAAAGRLARRLTSTVRNRAGRSPSRGLPRSPSTGQERKGGSDMMRTTMHTPWGPPQDIEELAEGVLRVSTAGHGGLVLTRERWNELPAAVRDTMLNATFAEEDCEEPIVRTLLGIGDDRDKEMALKVAGYFDSYARHSPTCGTGRLTTTSSPTWAAMRRTPSVVSTPRRRPRRSRTPDSGRPSRARPASRSAAGRDAGHDETDGRNNRRLPLLRRARGQAAQLPVVRDGHLHYRRGDGLAGGRGGYEP